MSKTKVLLVDEEDTILDAYSFLLRKEGYRVLTAYNGGKAIEKLCQQKFDLAITDFATKSGNGHTVLEEIKEMLPLIPVIVLTDKLSPIVKQFAFSMGAYALIEKPCSCEMLISCIRRSLKRNKGYH
jgi:two-component system response regulator VicR